MVQPNMLSRCCAKLHAFSHLTPSLTELENIFFKAIVPCTMLTTTSARNMGTTQALCYDSGVRNIQVCFGPLLRLSSCDSSRLIVHLRATLRHVLGPIESQSQSVSSWQCGWHPFDSHFWTSTFDNMRRIVVAFAYRLSGSMAKWVSPPTSATPRLVACAHKQLSQRTLRKNRYCQIICAPLNTKIVVEECRQGVAALVMCAIHDINRHAPFSMFRPMWLRFVRTLSWSRW